MILWSFKVAKFEENMYEFSSDTFTFFYFHECGREEAMKHLQGPSTLVLFQLQAASQNTPFSNSITSGWSSIIFPILGDALNRGFPSNTVTEKRSLFFLLHIASHCFAELSIRDHICGHLLDLINHSSCHLGLIVKLQLNVTEWE